MSALTFDKSELGNLEYSLQREMLATDRIGGYMSTTIVCCNTRRYHGLMVAPIDDSDRTYVLLSALDETIIQHDQTFNLALHRFQGTYEPRGHKYHSGASAATAAEAFPANMPSCMPRTCVSRASMQSSLWFCHRVMPGSETKVWRPETPCHG